MATLVFGMAIAYIRGVEEGISSQLYYIETLEEQLHPEIFINHALYFHPFRSALFGIGLFLTLCWISVAATVLAKKKPKI